jgi:hypothetical protein
MKHFLLVFTVCLFAITGYAQEQLRPLSGNFSLLKESAEVRQLSAKTTTVAYVKKDTLPFFDDFSYAYKSTKPTAQHWLDSNVFVNTGFAIAPISLGVATFDGLNKKGYPYNLTALLSSSANADYLTSRPINLFKKGSFIYGISDSLYLSFYYQAEGNGDAPEPNDSLSVDMFKPRQNKWVKVWGHKGYNPSATDTNFYRAMIGIKDTAYLDSAFQFRFRNKATLSGSLDHWHVDYVFLDKTRSKNDTIRNDIAFAYKPSSFLKNYFAMPNRQYIASEMAPGFTNYFRSNFNNNVFMDYNYRVFDKNNAPVSTNYNLGIVGNPGVQPFLNNGYYVGLPNTHSNPTLSFAYPTLGINDTLFSVKHILQASGDVYRPNDTVICTQKFTNYYALDDGSAEVGYYQNVLGAKTAARFTLNTNDTLKAVNIYFDPIVNGATIQNSTFRIMVWAANGNAPSNTVIYQDSTRNPIYLSGSYNLIPTYSLTSCLPLPAGNYFIGIKQSTNLGLNIGFDRNTNHIDALYYDNGPGWTQSTIPGGGSIMINPVMGCTTSTPLYVKEQKLTASVFIHPNPAQDEITLQSNSTSVDAHKVSVFNALGQEVLTTLIHNTKSIDVSSLPNGVYYIYTNSTLENVSVSKFVIAR